jgi:serine/threonine protein phosphatase PrpC
MNFASRTEAGLKGFNQDALATPSEDIDQEKYGICLAVADGITLCPKGGELALEAVKVVKNYYQFAKNTKPGEEALDAALEKLWEDFFVKVERDNDDDYLRSGATLTIALIFEKKLYLRHLGDSHCDIFYPNGSTFRITEEHNTEDGCLLNYFGGELQTAPQQEIMEFPDGSKVILSSDGVSYFVETDTMQKIGTSTNWDAEEMMQEMFALSDQAGSTDDKTVVLGY